VKAASLGKSHSLVAISLDHSASNLLQFIEGASGRFPCPFSSAVSLISRRSPFSEKEAATAKAIEKYESAIAIFEASLGKAHSARAISLNNYAVLLLKATKESDVLFLPDTRDHR